jgi:hypothetical protein
MSKDSRRWVFSKPGKRFYEWKIAMGQDPASHTGLMSRVVRTSAPAQRPRVACLLILLSFRCDIRLIYRLSLLTLLYREPYVSEVKLLLVPQRRPHINQAPEMAIGGEYGPQCVRKPNLNLKGRYGTEIDGRPRTRTSGLEL